MRMVVGDELPGNYHTLHRQARENYGAWWDQIPQVKMWLGLDETERFPPALAQLVQEFVLIRVAGAAHAYTVGKWTDAMG